MATVPEVPLNAIERKNLVRIADQLYKSTHFTKEEVGHLLSAYRRITGHPNGRVDRIKFRDLLHNQFCMSDDFFMDRVFRAFDKDNDGFLTHEEWTLGLSIFLRGTLQQKIEYCFGIYDLNDDGFISREEMFQMLKTTMVKQPTEEDPDEGIKDIVEIMVKKLDHDHDSKVSLEDFRATVEKERLLIEVFGPCLPPDSHVEQFSQAVLFQTH